MTVGAQLEITSCGKLYQSLTALHLIGTPNQVTRVYCPKRQEMVTSAAHSISPHTKYALSVQRLLQFTLVPVATDSFVFSHCVIYVISCIF